MRFVSGTFVPMVVSLGRVGPLRAAARYAPFYSSIALMLGMSSVFAHSQAAPKPEQTTPPPPQPGTGAQVQTGSQFGEQSIMNTLARLLADHQFEQMQQLLDAPDDASSSAAKSPLTPEQKQLYRGVLANRDNKPQESIQLLQPLLDKWKTTERTPSEKLLRKTLAEDYLRAGELAKANQAYLELEYRYGGTMTQDEKDEIQMPVRLLPLVYQFPPMTVEPGESFTLPYDRDALGLTDVPVFVDGQSHDWMLDPTAPFNLICRSTAKEIGLKISDEYATITTLTGHPMRVQAAVIPRFTIGTITYRDMTVFVFDDKDYYFPASNYQVRGVLGYPAVSALGSLTISFESNIEVHPGEKSERLTTGARFYLDGDRVIAALGKQGDERMFTIDAGGQQTYLTSRYFGEHADEFASKKMQLLALPGTQNKPPAPAYVADSATLQIGTTPVSIHYVQVLTQPLGDAALDDVYGTLGMDLFDELKSYTFDYRTMRFAVTTH